MDVMELKVKSYISNQDSLTCLEEIQQHLIGFDESLKTM